MVWREVVQARGEGIIRLGRSWDMDIALNVPDRESMWLHGLLWRFEDGCPWFGLLVPWLFVLASGFLDTKSV